MKEEIEKKFSEACSQVAKKNRLGQALVTGHRIEYFKEAAVEVATTLLEEKNREIAELKYKLEEEAEARELVADYLFKHVSDKWLNKMVEELRAKTKLYHDTKINP